MNDTIRISGVMDESIVDGKGMRYTIFTRGCPHACPGCHNPDTHDFRGGKEGYHPAVAGRDLENPMLKGVGSFGGEGTVLSAGSLGKAGAGNPCSRPQARCDDLHRIHLGGITEKTETRM